MAHPVRLTAAERALRQRLGIPLQASRVILFGETSHWDPNWLFTSERYYRLRIRRIIDAVIAALVAEPRRVFAIESLFFFKLYWERQPGQREILRRLVGEGRLKLSGSGITTPDTLLPDTESILRDFQSGQQWLREQGIEAEPSLAYSPDAFGHSPALPSILRALGYDQAGITRIDGMFFVGADYRPRGAFPLRGSSAELLTRQLKTLDFVWRGPDGAEVLCHWNAFSYFQGDMLAHLGIIRWMGLVFGMPWRSGGHISRRVGAFVRELEPLSRTPYMFCPIGCDFNSPIAGLVQLLDAYNARRYPQTGIWAVCAGMDDYLDLVASYRDQLPVIELDPNPYWMGFYASRPELKHACNRIAHKLGLAEKLSTVLAATRCDPGAASPFCDPVLQQELRSAWDLLVVSNHHDFITGTSPDRVWKKEQRLWLEQAEMLAQSALERVRSACPTPTVPVQPQPPRWRLRRGKLEVTSGHYSLVLDEAEGGCLTSLRLSGDQRELLEGPSNDLVAYRDSGGLWRMGHEFLGGTFREVSQASRLPARIRARERGGMLEVRVDSRLAGRQLTRWLWFLDNSPVIRLRLRGAAARRYTITCRFATSLAAHQLVMDVPGGVVARPPRKVYDPTFWPARSFGHLHDEQSDLGLAVFLSGLACLSTDGQGMLQWVALRNVPQERAFKVLPVPSHPASGSDPKEHSLEYAIWLTSGGDYRQNRLPWRARRVLKEGWLLPGAPDLSLLAESVLATDHPEVLVSAAKVASRGAGLIVRLESFGPSASQVRLHCALRPIQRATLCDARERDLAELKVLGGNVLVPLAGTLTSVRIGF